MHTTIRISIRAAACVLALVLGFTLAACGSSSKSSTTGPGGATPTTSTTPTTAGTKTTAPPPVVTGQDKNAFCQEAKNLIDFNAGTGKQPEIQKAMPAIQKLAQIAPAEIKASIQHIAGVFQIVASGGKLNSSNVPKTLNDDIKAYTAYVKKNCPGFG